MAKYHINKHGEPVRCPAKIKCRLTDNEGNETPHFEGTLEEAREWAEEKNSEGESLLPDSVSREVNYELPNSDYKDNAIAIHPEGCGCTDCLMKTAIPADEINLHSNLEALYNDAHINGREVFDQTIGGGEGQLIFSVEEANGEKKPTAARMSTDIKRDLASALDEVGVGGSFKMNDLEFDDNDYNHYNYELSDIDGMDPNWEVLTIWEEKPKHASDIDDDTLDYISQNQDEEYGLVRITEEGEDMFALVSKS